jgi:hypothetical protein
VETNSSDTFILFALEFSFIAIICTVIVKKTKKTKKPTTVYVDMIAHFDRVLLFSLSLSLSI